MPSDSPSLESPLGEIPESSSLEAPSVDQGRGEGLFGEISRLQSSNENVSKYVFKSRTAVAEAVLYKYPTYQKRTVICCSTMSGCPVGCRFCGAGDYFVRSLSAWEICEQVRTLVRDTETDPASMERFQIMFMSMGEPLLNLSQLSKAIRQLYQDYPSAKLLISTSAPKADYESLRRLSVEVPTVGLQFSVHESTDEARNALVPYPEKLTLNEIAWEGVAWFAATGRQPFFNYCVHEKNDTQADVDRLWEFFSPGIWQATLSVICERDEHVSAANERQRSLTSAFMEKMIRRGYSTRMFDPAGQDDIGGGCGQLWFVQDWMKRHPERAKPSCGNGLPKVHTPKGAQ